MRTVIAAIVPPRTFLSNSANYFLLKQNDRFVLDSQYIAHLLHLCGILNSISFDFVSRQLVQTNVPQILKKIPVPPLNQQIADLAARLVVGHDDFAGLADQLHIQNRYLSVSERIDVSAKLEVLIAKSYGLDRDDYSAIVDTFPAFKENPQLCDMDEIIWDNNNIKEFYGEMAKKALEIF